MKRIILGIMLLVLLYIANDACATSLASDIFGTIGPARSYSSENAFGYGLDLHASTYYINGSGEFFLWNDAVDGNQERFRVYIGIGSFYLYQAQFGFGEGGSSLRLRGNAAVGDILLWVFREPSVREGLPVIMLSGYAEYEFENNSSRYGFGISLPFIFPTD